MPLVQSVTVEQARRTGLAQGRAYRVTFAAAPSSRFGTIIITTTDEQRSLFNASDGLWDSVA